MPTFAEIITIGDEILYGQTLDTNSHWISARLDEIGIKVLRKTTIGDTREEILSSFREAESRVDIILITGGLGPTSDDLTKPLLNEYFQSKMILNEEALHQIEELFTKAGRTMTEANRKQAELPDACRMIRNRMGTAPGMWFDKGNKVFISMPGVPYEMKTMMTEQILPQLKDRFVDLVIHHKIIRTIGIPESTLAHMIEEWEKALPSNVKLAYLPTMGSVKLRLTSIGHDLPTQQAQTQKLVDAVLPTIQKFVYGFDDDEIEAVVGRMLKAKNKTIALAESCTGGYISHLLTVVPGSSEYFKGSIVSYAYDVKENSLDVDPVIMTKMGAVSEEVVMQMATAVRQKLNADVSLAISGIAGPGGGTPEKPVGTVWIAYSDENKTVAKRFQFTKDRKLNIQFAATAALNMFRVNFSGD